MTRRRNSVFLGWTLALLAIAGFARAGFWQLERRDEKQAMLDAVATVLQERRPVPLAAASDPARNRAYDWLSSSTGGSAEKRPGPALQS